MVCKGCGRGCNDAEESIEIACVSCEESGKGSDGEPCKTCNGKGYESIQGCPKKAIGFDMTSIVNLAGYASKGHLPVDGGVLDQSAWFLDMWSTLESDQAKIDNELAERRKRGR